MRGVYIQNNSPYYWIRYYNKFEEDPKRRRKSLNTKIKVTPADRKIAEEAHKKGERAKLTGNNAIRKLAREFQQGLAEWAMQKNSGIKLIRKDKTLSEGFADFIRHRTVPGRKNTLKEKTLITYRLAVNHIIESCTDKYIYKYRESDYVKLLYRFEHRKLSINSRSIYTRSLRTLWKYFVEKKYTGQNIIEVIEPEELDPHPIPLTDMRSILNFLKGSTYKHHFQIIYFMLLTGSRPSSAIVQEKADIDFTAKTITIQNIKAGSRKGKLKFKFPMYHELEKLLKEIGAKEGDTGRLFYQFAVIPGDYTSPLRFWNRTIQKLFLSKSIREKYTLKQIRPTLASYLINVLEMDIYDVKKLLDHANIKITDKHYVNYKLTRVRKKLKNVTYESFLTGESEEF